MKTIILVSLLTLVAMNAAHGQCPGVYIYTDYNRNGCEGMFQTFIPVPIYIWAYGAADSVECADFTISYDACTILTEPEWDPSVTVAVGDWDMGYGVCFAPCDTGWHYLGTFNAIPMSYCTSVVGEVVGAPFTGSLYPRLGGCAPEYETFEVQGGGVYVSGTSHPPCTAYAGPDLLIEDWAPGDLPDTALAGEEIPFSWFLLRNGGCEEASSIANGYYLSPDPVITLTDVLLASTSPVGELDVYADTLFSSTTVRIPRETATGEYYIGILGDNTNAVTETDETNNYVSTGLTIVGAPRTWHILPDGSGDAPTIQAGIDSAAYLDTVLVACGTYHEHDIVMKSGVTLVSETADFDCVTIDAQEQGRVFYCDGLDSSTTIEGLTITGGRDWGAGLLFLGGGGTVRNCMMADNYGQSSGGGAYVGDSSTTVFENCIFADNAAGNYGGGLRCYSGSTPTLLGCTFYGNSAPSGAGISTSGSGSVVTGDRCILAFGTGAATHCHFDGAVTLTCSDVYGNSGGDWTDCIAGHDGSNGNFSGDPMFCDPDSLDFTLESGSPCIDAPGCGQVGALGEGCGLSAVDAGGRDAVAFRLHTSRPNPSNGSTRISFSMARAGTIRIAVYDARGRKVALLADGHSGAGEFELTWDATDASGRRVPPGVYFCRLTAGERMATEKIVLVR